MLNDLAFLQAFKNPILSAKNDFTVTSFEWLFGFISFSGFLSYELFQHSFVQCNARLTLTYYAVQQ